MQEIYLDSYHLHSLTTAGLPTSVSQGVEGLDFPTVRQSLYNKPGVHGATLAHSFYGQRAITLQGWIRGADTAAYRANRQAFSQACGLQLDSNNLPVLRTLKFTDDSGTSYQTAVSTSSLVMKDTYPTLTQWQLQLVAPDWRFYNPATKSAAMVLPVSGGVTFPVTFPITFGASSGGAATATNDGTVETSPTITITGPVTNPVVANATTGERFALTITLADGESAVIDTVNYTVVKTVSGVQGSSSIMPDIVPSSVFFSLQPGDNDLTFAADTYQSGSVSVTWNDAFLSL